MTLEPIDVWGWLHLGEAGEPPTLAVQVLLGEDLEPEAIDVNLEMVIEDNIKIWIQDGQYEEMEKWRDLLTAFATKINVALDARKR
jgi:hypothetical protein